MPAMPYYQPQIPNPGMGMPNSGMPRNALVGIGNPPAQNALQVGAQPFQQHPMMYQPMQQGYPQQAPWTPQQHIPSPVQWPNPHQGAYQEWMQKFNPRTGPNSPQRY